MASARRLEGAPETDPRPPVAPDFSASPISASSDTTAPASETLPAGGGFDLSSERDRTVTVLAVLAPCGCLVLEDEWCRSCGGCQERTPGREWCCYCGIGLTQRDLELVERGGEA